MAGTEVQVQTTEGKSLVEPSRIFGVESLPSDNMNHIMSYNFN